MHLVLSASHGTHYKGTSQCVKTHASKMEVGRIYIKFMQSSGKTKINIFTEYVVFNYTRMYLDPASP